MKTDNIKQLTKLKKQIQLLHDKCFLYMDIKRIVGYGKQLSTVILLVSGIMAVILYATMFSPYDAVVIIAFSELLSVFCAAFCALFICMEVSRKLDTMISDKADHIRVLTVGYDSISRKIKEEA